MASLRRFKFLIAAALAICVLIVVGLLVRERGTTLVVSPGAESRPSVASNPVASIEGAGQSKRVVEPIAPASDPASTQPQSPKIDNPVVVVVVDENEAPISGATVEITDEGPVGFFAADEQGRCVLPIESGNSSVQLRVSADGYVTYRVRYSRSPEIPITLHRSLHIRGRVVEAGVHTAIAYASVHVTPSASGGGVDLRTTAGESGEFEIDGIPAAEVSSWVAEADGFATSKRDLKVSSSDSDIVLQLSKGVPMTFAVVDASTRSPIAGAHVYGNDSELTADASGRIMTSALLAVGAKEAGIRARADGYCDLLLRVTSVAAASAAVFELPLVQTIKITGTVRNRAGAALENATVAIRSAPRTGHAQLDAALVAPLVALPSGSTVVSQYPYPSATTDHDGRFVIDGVLPWYSQYQYVAYAPGCRALINAIKETGEPGTTMTLDIVLVPVGDVSTLTGSITLNGVPCLARVSWKGATRDGSARTGDDGRYRIDNVECGDVALTVAFGGFGMVGRCRDLLPCERRVQVQRDGDCRADFAFNLDLATIRGRVMAADGSPAKGISVDAFAPDSCWAEHGTTDVDGRFDLHVDPAVARYGLEVGHGVDSVTLSDVAPNTSDLKVVLPGAAQLRVRVLSAETHESQTRFHITLHDERNGHQEFDSVIQMGPTKPEPDVDGWYLVDVKPGRYQLIVGDSFGEPSGQLPSSASNVVVRIGEKVPIEFVREKGLSVELTLAPDQQPWSAQEFTAVLLEPSLWNDVDLGSNGWNLGPSVQGVNVIKSRTVRFDEKGRATVKALAPGTYRFKVFPATMSIEPSEVTVPLANDQPLEIRWTRK